MKTINSCYKAGPRSQVPFSEPNDKAEWLYDIEKCMNCPESVTKNWRAGILPMKARPEFTLSSGEQRSSQNRNRTTFLIEPDSA